MTLISRYHLDLSGRELIPRSIWWLLLVTFGLAVSLGIYFLYRQPHVQTLQAKLLSQQLLPSPQARPAAIDPQLRQQYREVLKASQELSLPIQLWLTCLQSPPSAPIQIVSFDLNTASEGIELRIAAHSHDEATEYLDSWQKKGSTCFAAVSQEERNPDGGSLLSVKLRPNMEVPSR
jgi:hypothetical protein